MFRKKTARFQPLIPRGRVINTTDNTQATNQRLEFPRKQSLNRICVFCFINRRTGIVFGEKHQERNQYAKFRQSFSADYGGDTIMGKVQRCRRRRY